MPTLRIPPDLDLHYVIDDYTDPWGKAGTVLLLHGNAESGAAWYGWVPHLGRRFRLVRPDMRGYGASTPMARDYPWTIDAIIDDYRRLMDKLGIERFHLVGAKIGGTIARAFAARHASRVQTLTVIGTPPRFRAAGPATRALQEEFEQFGVEHWARRTMAARRDSGVHLPLRRTATRVVGRRKTEGGRRKAEGGRRGDCWSTVASFLAPADKKVQACFGRTKTWELLEPSLSGTSFVSMNP